MDVRQLEYFLAVVDHGGVGRAAAALHVSQPSLSQSLRTLERDLRSDLFHRIGRRVVLTEAGHALVAPAREAVRGLDLARSAVESVQGLRTGRVDVATLGTQAIEPLTGIIAGFTERHPGISVSLRGALTDRDAVQMVRTGACELGVVATDGPAAETEVRVHPLTRQAFVLLAPADGPFAHGKPVPVADLAGHRLIVGHRGSGMRRFVDRLLDEGLDARIAVETEHRVSLLPLVLDGAGYAVVTDAWRGLAERSGTLALDLEPTDHLHVSLISRKGPLTAAARAFVEHATGAPA